MIVVSNTSPIINLATVGQLNILRELYGTINIADAVYKEIVLACSGLPGSNEVQHETGIQNKSVADKNLVQLLKLDLDAGESETLILATELKADLVLMDESKGRMAANMLGLKIVGILGYSCGSKSVWQD